MEKLFSLQLDEYSFLLLLNRPQFWWARVMWREKIRLQAQFSWHYAHHLIGSATSSLFSICIAFDDYEERNGKAKNLNEPLRYGIN